jgi:hypothetical protein
MNNDPCKIFKNIFFWDTKIEKKEENCNSYGFMKMWSNFNHSKVPNYQMVKGLKETIHGMSLSFCISSYIESQ